MVRRPLGPKGPERERLNVLKYSSPLQMHELCYKAIHIPLWTSLGIFRCRQVLRMCNTCKVSITATRAIGPPQFIRDGNTKINTFTPESSRPTSTSRCPEHVGSGWAHHFSLRCERAWRRSVTSTYCIAYLGNRPTRALEARAVSSYPERLIHALSWACEGKEFALPRYLFCCHVIQTGSWSAEWLTEPPAWFRGKHVTSYFR